MRSRHRRLEESYIGRLIFFFTVYLFQGLPNGYALTALALYYTEHGVALESLGSYASVIGVPWAFKFLWGPLLDSLPNLRFGRRRLPIVVLFFCCAFTFAGRSDSMRFDRPFASTTTQPPRPTPKRSGRSRLGPKLTPWCALYRSTCISRATPRRC